MQTSIETKKININVLFFASVSEFLGKSKLTVEIQKGSTVKDLKDLIFKEKVWNKPLLYAINNSYVSLDSELKENDEVVFMSFVSGG